MYNIVCINCDSVIDNNLNRHNIEYLEYNKNTTNEKKIISDLSNENIDMTIINTVKNFKNLIKIIDPKYFALINKKMNYLKIMNFTIIFI